MFQVVLLNGYSCSWNMTLPYCISQGVPMWLSILPNITKPTNFSNQITYANLFHLQPIWLENKRLSIDGTNVQYFGPSTQKQRLAKLTKSFIMQDGMLYQMGLDNKLGQCVTTYHYQKKSLQPVTMQLACNQLSFVTILVMFTTTNLVLYNFWAIRLCVQLTCN